MNCKFLGAKKSFLSLFFIFIAILFIGWFVFLREVKFVCANGELVRTIIETAENATYEIMRIRPLEKKLKFCEYVLKKKNVEEYIVVFTDRDLEYIIIGDILDVKSGKFIGYEDVDSLQKRGKENGTD